MKGVDPDSKEAKLYGDIGRYAMARNYDAIHVPQGTQGLGVHINGAKDQYVILNRGKVIAEAPGAEGPVRPRKAPAVKKAAPEAPVAKKAAPEKPTITREKKAVPAAEKAAKKAAAVEERMRRALPAVREAAKEAAAEATDDQALRMRARGSLLDRDIRDLRPELVDAEMRRLREQDRIDEERLRAAGPRPQIDESVALRGDPEGDNSIMHGDSPAMNLAQALAKRNRNGSANRVMELRRDYSRNVTDLDASQRAIDELRLMRAAETDPEIRKLYDKALAQMDAPVSGIPDIPVNTPPALRQLLEDLNRIPLARRVESGNLPDRQDRVSAVEQLAEIFREAGRGELTGSRRELDNRIRDVLRRYHESRDGAYPMWNLETRLDAPEMRGQLAEWSRRGQTAEEREPFRGQVDPDRRLADIFREAAEAARRITASV
jgi:hypothetical protein